MDASNVPVLTWPSCTSNDLPSIDNRQSSASNERKSQAVVLNGISLPVVQLAQQEGQQTPFHLGSGGTSFSIENTNLSVIFTSQPQNILQKNPAQTITLNIVNTLPILSPTSPACLIGTSPGKSKSFGKHICAHCGRDCLKPSVLEKHIRSHTGERPFPCNICGISFKTQSNLYKHRRTQTHVNNTKQSLDSDCGSCHEDKLHGHVGHNTCLDISTRTRDVYKNLDGVQESDYLPGNTEEVSLKIHDKAHEDSDYSSQTIVLPGMPNLQRTVIDPKSTASSRHGQLQRQHEAFADKQWDSSPSERKLKKCESTDSGYLSHSDSADLQIFAGSPLHSLSECSIESENMLSIGSGDSEDKTASSHKKNLEERISMLISQNKVVVDNTHLDNVRPRKTALSKQGSIDLPMPYTFKDSFHFDIKSLDANRKVSLCSAKSTFTPSEKNKPLFFHSVPTQISTTIESAILTRSNSLPYVESGRLKDRLTVHNTKSHGSGKPSLNASYGNVLLSNTAAACTVDFSCSHPRGLVRQAAVDEMQIGNGSDSPTSVEIKEKKKVAGDQISSKSKMASKKGGQKKSNMFSHEKWQIYGDETFKKFYQKIKKSEQVKKTKQDNPEPKVPIGNEICLQAARDLEKPSENLATIPMVSPPTSSLQITCTSPMTSVGKEMDATISTGTHQITLKKDNSQGNQPEANFHSNLNITKGDINGFQNVLANDQIPSTGGSDNPDIVVTKNHQKGTSISSIHDHLEADYTENYQSHEGSPSDRKKLKVAQLKGEILYSVSLDITEDHQNKGVDGITDSENTARTLDGDGASTVLSCHSLSSILNENLLLPHGEDSGQTPAESKKSQLLMPTTQPPSAPKETLFSPRYLIKFNFTGTSVEESVLQSNQPKDCGRSSKDTDLFNVSEDANSKCLLVPTKLYHPTLLENQPKLIQKHDSVIAAFGKISGNEKCVPVCCSSKFSQHLVQNKSLDTQECRYQKVRLDDTYLERPHTSVEGRVAKDISKQMALKSSMALVGSGTMSTNEVNKPSQDPLLPDIIRPGQTCRKPLNATGFLNQENSMFPTAHTYLTSGICSMKVTQVSFSTMNTEPKSTWCWLDRCLPFPAEQKERSYSVYASLSTDAFKETRSEPLGRIEKDVKHNTTLDGQPGMSSLLMSAKQKDCLEGETDNSNYHPLVKRSSKMGTVMKSRHVKRSKDGTHGRSHGKMSQHKSPGALVQDQQHKKTTSLSSLESGEILLRTTNFELSNKEGSRTSIHHPTCQPGDLGQRSEGKTTPGSQMISTSTTSVPSEHLATGEDNPSLQPTEEMAHPEPRSSASLIWQKSCSNVLPTGNVLQLDQHLRGCPPQKHVRKMLRRSKTIAHSLGDDSVGSTSGMTSSDSQPGVRVEAKDGIRRSSLQNIHSHNSYMVPNTSSFRSTLGPGILSLSQKLQSETREEPSSLQRQSLKTQKKINLELMRKQTHVECSDSSSDDEDRLYIEIFE